MDFVKKHWEKILLGLVLVGLLVALGFLPLKVASERGELERRRVELTQFDPKPIEPVGLTEADTVLARARTPVQLDLSTSNRVVNPVLWQRSQSGAPIKVQTGNEVGAAAIKVESITPLYLKITLDSVLNLDSGARYAIGVEKQAAVKRSDRRKRQTYASVGDKNKNFELRGVRGPADDPTEVMLTLTETGDQVVVGKTKPFQKIDGYMADMEYPPESRKWKDRRVGDRISCAGESYNIVAITEDEVVLSAPSGKKTSLKFDPSISAEADSGQR